MAKGQTFAEVFPLGTCFLCGEPCSPMRMVHSACAVAYTIERSKRLKAMEKPINDK